MCDTRYNTWLQQEKGLPPIGGCCYSLSTSAVILPSSSPIPQSSGYSLTCQSSLNSLESVSPTVGAPPSLGPLVSQSPAVKTSLSTDRLVFLWPTVWCSDPQVFHFASPRSGFTSVISLYSPSLTSASSSSLCSP